MEIVDVGTGTPLVFIPGLQGRWEYMRRAVDALARSFRVIAFSLADEPGTGCPFDPSHPIDSYAAQVIRALDQCGIGAAAICGISFGGVIALRVAAEHPERVSALVLASTPGPGWALAPDHAFFVRYPRLTAPLFFAGIPARTRAELVRALPSRRDRARLGMDAMRTFLAAPVSPSRMSARARAIEPQAITADLARLAAPTLVIVGEEALDRVVPAGGTAEYARLIPGARLVRLEHTGHQGCITRPGEFAAAIDSFINGQRHAAA